MATFLPIWFPFAPYSHPIVITRCAISFPSLFLYKLNLLCSLFKRRAHEANRDALVFYPARKICRTIFCCLPLPVSPRPESASNIILAFYESNSTVSLMISNALSHSSSLTISGGTIRMMWLPIAVISIWRSKQPCFTSTPEIVSSNSTPTKRP